MKYQDINSKMIDIKDYIDAREEFIGCQKGVYR